MPEIEPYLWRWSQVEPLVLKSGELVTPDRDVERRTLRLATPGIDRGTTHTITAALQLLLPGENAPAHRHTPTAIRWVLKGQGAYTTVEGDKCYMEPGRPGPDSLVDLARPQQRGNRADDLAGRLDVPLVRYLRANFYEPYPEDQQPIVGVAESERKFASGALRPAWESPNAPTPRYGTTSGTRPGKPCNVSPKLTPAPSTTWRWSSAIRPPGVLSCAP